MSTDLNVSPTSSEESRNGQKGKRKPGVPGRFSPDQPLHMTTRRAAKSSVANGDSPSVNGSVVDGDSRRASFEDLQDTTAMSLGSPSSSRSKQLPDATDPLFTLGANSNATEPLDNDTNGYEENVASSPQSQSSEVQSRKRKRSSSRASLKSSPDRPETRLIQDPDTMELVEDDSVSVVGTSQLSDRAASESASSGSREQPNGHPVTAPPSTDITPIPSNGGSPASSMSGSEIETPVKPTAERDDTAIGEDDGEAFEETELADDGEDGEDGDEVDDQAQSADEDRPKRRMGGRKRVAHPIVRVETAMRRQADVKTAYRQITRALKSLLVELTQRTTDELTEQPQSYKEASEYEEVKAGLDDALERRQTCIRTQLELDKKLLQNRLETEKLVRSSQLKLQLAELDDYYLHRIEQNIIAIARAVETNEETQYYTEDEDDVIPRLKQAAYRYKRGPALDLKFDSRSRLILETSGAVDKMNARHKMHQMLEELDAADRPEGFDTTFTVMDSEPREVALSKRESIARTRLLADAAAEIDRVANIKIIPNDQATGLQLLGDLASRPSITAPARNAAITLQNHVLGHGQPIAPPLPSPGLSVRGGQRTFSIELLNPAPRPHGEPYDTSMPPPSTPRQTHTTAAFSPAVSKFERPTPDRIYSSGRPSLAPISPGNPHRAELETVNPMHGHPQRDWSEPRGHKREFSQDNDLHRVPTLAEQQRGMPMDIDRRPGTQDGPSGFGLPRIAELTGGIPARDPRESDRPYEGERPLQSIDLLTRRPPSQPTDKQPPPTQFMPYGYQFPRPASPPQTQNPVQWMPPMEQNRPTQQPTPAISLDNQELRTDGGQSLESQRRQKNKSYQGPFRKSTKDERNGDSRRKGRKSTSSKPATSNQPLRAGPPATDSPATIAQREGEPRRPSFGSYSNIDPALLPPPLPPPGHGYPGPYGPMPQMQPYPYAQHPPYDYHQQSHHRHSFPSAVGSPPGWHPQPHSSLYAMPQGPSPPPPPPGGQPSSSDQYNPQGSYAPPPPPPPSSMLRPLAPGIRERPPVNAPTTQGSQFGGPTIRPAPGYLHSPHNLPAFAQQRAYEDSRKRAQSDAAQQPRIRQWTPGPKQKKDNNH